MATLNSTFNFRAQVAVASWRTACVVS
jgi:hypothetical protein